MRNSLKSKLTIPSVAILFTVVLAVVLYSSNIASRMAHDLIWERAQASLSAAAAYIAQMEQQTNIVANAVAGDYEILVAIQAWNAGIDRAHNRALIINRLQELVVTFGVDSFTVRDFEGRTIARLHDLDFYNDIDGLINAVNAIEHRKTTTSFTSTAALPMSLLCTVPIIHQEEVLGTIAPIFHFNTENFVNHLSAIFGTPVSIYRGRERIMTALYANYLYEPYASESIASIVIGQGNSYMASHKIGNAGAISYYMPFFGVAGNPIGMMAVHFSTEEADAATRSMIFTMVIIGFLGIFSSAAIMILLITRRLKPLDGLAKSVKTVAEGGFNATIDVTSAPSDEIGTMTQYVNEMVTLLAAAYNEKLKAAIYANQLQVMEESLEKTRAFKHDTKLHIYALKEYAKHDKTDDIRHYLDRLISDIDYTEIFSNTGNIAFDSIINYKLRNVNDIKPQLYINVPPKINIDAADIAIIMGNLIDNALEALAKSTGKKLQLDIQYSRGILFVTVKNSFSGEVSLRDGQIVSTKRGEHGYGLKNIKQAANKYNGDIEISYENNYFNATVLLYEQERPS
ncbi:MAG: GHKL domain-containing protein [Defluviitaleaceae bacterium]|nr:GHKL domain-containing protein [Defluviitaleaceae bacterium]MCL2274946.1 GHKL domain-containing protein [Defluviitaleaceae bacterium]